MRKLLVRICVSVLFGSGLFLLSRYYDYLLFHSIAELFGVVITFGIFALIWNSRKFLGNNNYLLFLGIAFVFVAFLDMLHIFAYKGMGVFKGYDANLPTQLWIAARYTASISMLIASFFTNRKLRSAIPFTAFSILTILLLVSIFFFKNFPACFIEGVGLTPFKIISEYIISSIVLISIYLLFRKRMMFDKNVLLLLVSSMIITIFSELSFTLYTDVYGISNAVGHLFKIASFYLIYRAIIVTGLVKPYDLLFKNLKDNEEELRRSKEDLEVRVQERTKELAETNKELQDIIKKHELSQEELKSLNQQLNALHAHMEQVREEVRKKIALDIHDKLGQALTGLKLDLAWIMKHVPKIDEQLKYRMELMSSLIDDTIDLTRKISSEIRPAVLDIGLVTAIQWQANEFQERSGITCNITSNIDEVNMDKDRSTSVFRIFQEILTNIARHADASVVDIKIYKNDFNLLLEVKDNGKGIKKSEILNPDSLGIFGMRQRASLLGGTFDIHGMKVGGTKTVLNIPIE
ncbi:MAG: histidine kinase [Actinobacteria bacterium]|nr:histidine kinase [Actinomycetota bacterium]